MPKSFSFALCCSLSVAHHKTTILHKVSHLLLQNLWNWQIICCLGLVVGMVKVLYTKLILTIESKCLCYTYFEGWSGQFFRNSFQSCTDNSIFKILNTQTLHVHKWWYLFNLRVMITTWLLGSKFIATVFIYIHIYIYLFIYIYI